MIEQTFPIYTFPIKDNLYRVIDGDTVEVHLDRGWGETKKTALRVAGVDSPESHTRQNLLEREAGQLVTKVVVKWLADHANEQLYASSDEKPKYYGRTVGRIWAGSTDCCLNDYLVERCLVAVYAGGTKPAWDDGTLSAIIKTANEILTESA